MWKGVLSDDGERMRHSGVLQGEDWAGGWRCSLETSQEDPGPSLPWSGSLEVPTFVFFTTEVPRHLIRVFQRCFTALVISVTALKTTQPEMAGICFADIRNTLRTKLMGENIISLFVKSKMWNIFYLNSFQQGPWRLFLCG